MNLQSLMPALQHLAKYPGANIEHVAQSRGVSVIDLKHVIKSGFGGLSSLDEESLKDFAEKNHLRFVDSAPVHLPAVKERDPDRELLDSLKSETEETEERPEEPAQEPPAPRASTPHAHEGLKRWPTMHFKNGGLYRMVPVLQAIAEGGWSSVSKRLTAGKFEVSYATFMSFKNRVFLSGMVDKVDAIAFLDWAKSAGHLNLTVTRIAKPAPEQAPAKEEPQPAPASAPQEIVENIRRLREQYAKDVARLENERDDVLARLGLVRCKVEALDEAIAAISA